MDLLLRKEKTKKYIMSDSDSEEEASSPKVKTTEEPKCNE
ncbi:hypothetical protein OROMI_004226 [Orobanche minor]